jgi:hypothetical protein
VKTPGIVAEGLPTGTFGSVMNPSSDIVMSA